MSFLRYSLVYRCYFCNENSYIAGSSNGRTQLSESCYLGSSPSPAAMVREECQTALRMKHIASRDAGENAGACEASKPSREAVPNPRLTGQPRGAGESKSRSNLSCALITFTHNNIVCIIYG